MEDGEASLGSQDVSTGDNDEDQHVSQPSVDSEADVQDSDNNVMDDDGCMDPKQTRDAFEVI